MVIIQVMAGNATYSDFDSKRNLDFGQINCVALKLQRHGDLIHNVESIYRLCSLKQYLQDCDGHHRFSSTVRHVVLWVTHSNINVNKFVLTESG